MRIEDLVKGYLEMTPSEKMHRILEVRNGRMMPRVEVRKSVDKKRKQKKTLLEMLNSLSREELIRIASILEAEAEAEGGKSKEEEDDE